LLSQTFSGSHTVNSGNLTFSLTVTPTGSKTLTGPITLSFGGPFQSLGKGKLPKSNFTVSIGALGKSASLGILSTGTAGYVSLQGTSYQLPQATFQKLESSFASFESTGSGGSSSSALTKLGIKPIHWLTNPHVAGTDSVAGASTTHITAGLNVSALLDDISTLLSKAGSLGLGSTGQLPTSISASTKSKIAAEVQNPTVDVWTGMSDKTIRRLTLKLTLPVSGSTSALLGGLTSAQIALTIQYAALNQPQTITAPTSLAPYSQFTAKLQQFVQTLQSTVAATASGVSGGSTGSTGTTGTGTTGGGTLDPYTKCIESASSPLKAQKCAKLLNSSGG
jgi:hypothetical protein